MQLTEIYADAEGETHFRQTEIDMELREYAPPSKAVHVSSDTQATTYLYLDAPPGWDDAYHPTPRKQLCVILRGVLKVTATDGESRELAPGGALLLNDTDCKGHLSQVQGDQDMRVLLVGIE